MAVGDLGSAGGWRPSVAEDGRIDDVVRVVDLDRSIDAAESDDVVRSLRRCVAVTVGIARRAPHPAMLRVAEQLDCCLTSATPSGACFIAVPDVDAALDEVTRAVERQPRAALMLVALLRQTGALDVASGLAAEAAAYSALLAGPEHAQWLRSRTSTPPADDESARVQVRRDGDVLDVVLSRPHRRNAYDRRMRMQLYDALLIAVGDERLRLRLRGAGPDFCAGGDLDEFGTTPDPATAWVVRVAEHPGRLLAEMAPRAEARLHGACVGAGIELPAFAGRVVAQPDSVIWLPEVAMGLLPGAGGTVSIPRRIGRWRTAWLGLTGRRLDAQTARTWGLVDELISPGG